MKKQLLLYMAFALGASAVKADISLEQSKVLSCDELTAEVIEKPLQEGIKLTQEQATELVKSIEDLVENCPSGTCREKFIIALLIVISGFLWLIEMDALKMDAA